ncbi:hypothetical protein [Leptodesmis sichuanensis]|uniref:hypothetical protein n=1 Tax=Leptodesmis sichuanensis TaxID=2906798 RepID=UPI001F3723EF|nr:hypothetical protein [Leptodesmis sichuanensis]UIE36573.1 hypothetical protein KIK02_16190 [Leptodesmis sichuanensis A121]
MSTLPLERVHFDFQQNSDRGIYLHPLNAFRLTAWILALYCSVTNFPLPEACISEEI